MVGVVEVRRLTVRDEVVHIVRLAAVIVLGVWLYLATALGGDSVRKNLLPFQALIQTRSTTEQRMFRELQEGLLEAEASRSSTGRWPTTETLQADGIPPFAIDPTVRNARYRWQLLRDGLYVNYLGLPDRDDAPAWLLVVLEPEPGVAPDQTTTDEEHHKLLDGTMLHVSTWAHANGVRVPDRAVRVPQAEGWTQLYAVGPGGQTGVR